MLTKLIEERARLITAMRSTLDVADGESRIFTAEETQEYDRQEARVSELDAEIAKRNRLSALKPAEGLVLGGSDAAVVEPGAEVRTVDPLGTPEYRNAFMDYIRKGRAEERALSVGTASGGGYTVPVSFSAEIIKSLRQFGQIRNLAKVIPTAEGNTLNIPSGTGFGSGGWGTEGGTFTGTDPSFGQVSLSAYKVWQIVQVSEELLQDSGLVDLEGYVAQALGENLALLQNTAFVNGTGAGQPTGFITNGATGVTAGNGTVQVSAILPDTLFDIQHSLTVPYRPNASWVLHDSSLKIIRKLKDSQNRYLWEMALTAGAPDTLLGKPVYIDPDMPVMAASAKSIAYGDFQRYIVRTAGGIGVQRLNELYAATGQVGFRVFERLDGKIADTAAIKLFVNAAS